MPPSTMPPPDHLRPFGQPRKLAAPAAGVRRKTPSELRQEQLNRIVRSRSCQDGTIGPLPCQGSAVDLKKNGPRLVDTRVADVFAATKPHERPKLPFLKQKDDLNRALSSGSIETSRAFRNHIAEEPLSIAMAKDHLSANDGKSETAQNQNLPGNFRDVRQLSSTTKLRPSGSAVDMAEALKLMAPTAERGFGRGSVDSAGFDQVQDSSSPIIDTSSEKLKTPPLDLSLKLSARFLSVDSLHWCHRKSSASEVEGVKLFVEKFKWNDKEDLCSQPAMLGDKGMQERFGARFCQALHSWVHPPPQYLELYDMALASSRGDTRKSAIFMSLSQMWEDSFRSLYYMFCHKHCNLFYFCTQQFVVMFERGNSAQGDESGSNAYWTRSTRGLRKKLQEHGLEFSMPFCTSEADMSSLEDLHELTEFEKLNPGQTRVVDPRTGIDNNSQSLLAFEASNVHRLFDFLLNYRFLVGTANAADFPVLYSPVEFSKASLYMPEVKCKLLQHSAENVLQELPMRNGSITHPQKNAPDMFYSLELKGAPGAYITPWVIQAVCMVLQRSQKLGFETSFVTGPLSEALNVAQERRSAAMESLHAEKVREAPLSRTHPTGVSKSKMRTVKHLRYHDGLYQARFAGFS